MATTSVTSTSSGATVSSGNPFDVVSGGSLVSATILSGGSVTVQVGGSDTDSIISAGGSETVSGTATGDMVAGMQVVTAGSAVVSDETILNGGTIQLLKSGATGSALTVESGGTLNISGAATASNTVVSGGLVDLQSAAASVAGTLTFAGSATLEISSVASSLAGALATIGGFAAGDVIDVAFISSGATLTTATSGGNTLATITSGGVTETLTFSGTTIGNSLALVNAGAAGEEIAMSGALPSITSVTTSTASGAFVVSSGTPLDVLSGGTIVAATILSGGSAIIQAGGVDSGSTISVGGNETVLGTASGDVVGGIQLISAGTAVVNNDTILNGGTVELFLASAVTNGLTVDSGGTFLISGHAFGNNTVLSGGLLELQSPKSTISGSLTFAGSATLEETDTIDPISSGTLFGDLAVISGFGAGDVIDLTAATSAGAAGTAATLSETTSGGNTVATVSGGGSSEAFIFAGTTIGPSLELVSDGQGGEEIISSTVISVSSSTSSGAFVVSGGQSLDVLAGGAIVAATVLDGGSVTIQAGGVDSGSTISAGGNETVIGSATGDLVSGTQSVSGTSASVSNETVVSGGGIVVNGSATATNMVISGGTLTLASPQATIAGTVTFAGSGALAIAAVSSSGFGDQAIISGFGGNDSIDLTSATAIGAAGSAATLTTTTSGGNTIATVSGGGSSESFVLAGTAVASSLQLGSDNNGGEAITSATSSSTLPPALSAFTAGDLVISISGDGEDDGDFADNAASPIVLQELTTAGSIVGQLDLPQITTVVNGVTEFAISGEFGSSSEGTLQLSANGESLVIMGYGVNATAFNEGGTPTFGTPDLAQSTSLQGGPFTAVPRVIADISFNGSIDTSTALFNVFNTNNPRSVATVNGTSFFISGQGVKGDTTQGLFVAQDGASSATPIDTSEDTRSVEIINGQLFLSVDSTQGVGGQILNFGASLPTGPAMPTVLPGIDGSITLTAAQQNGINDADVGQSVNLSPENFFFASSTVLYVADGGDPKEGGLGDGGLQKWIFNGTSWNLAYTLTAGLNLVPDTDAHGTSGLIGLTGTVLSNGNVELFATNETLNDLDQTFLFGITDTLSATTLPSASAESFQVLETAAPDTLIRGVSFAPTASATVVSNTTISAGSSQSGVQVTSGSFLDILNGGTAISATVFSGGSATVELGGIDSGSFIQQGAEETVLGTATGDTVDGTQLVSAATAVVSNESILNGGVVELFLSGASGIGLSVNSGGALVISGAATASNTVLSGGLVALDSADATLTGTLTFAGSAALDIAAVADAADGDQAVISGFGAGDAIDLSSATAIGAAGSAATLTSTTSGANTIETISGGGSSESFIFAGTTIGGNLVLGADGLGGEQITFSATAVPGVNVGSGVTSSGLVVSNGETLNVLAGGTLLSATIQNGGTVLVETGGIDSGSTIAGSGFENVSGSATGDLVAGTQLVSNGTAIVSNETVTSGGSVDLFLKGAIADNVTVDSGGFININGNATTSNTVLNGGTLDLQSPKANFTGSLTFSGSGGVIEETDTVSAGFGDLGVISGFGAGDLVDDTVIGAGATLSTTTSGGNTIASIVNGGVSQPFTFAGTTIGTNLTLVSDGNGGEEIALSVTSSTVAADQTLGLSTTRGDETLAGGGTGDVLLGGAGNNTLSVSGANDVITTNGTSTATASGSNDLIVAVSGLTTISASGANAGVLGGSGSFSAVLTGNAATLSAAQSNAMVTVGGSNAVVFGGTNGTNTLNVDDTGGNSTIATFGSNATINAAGSNALIFGGTGTSNVSVSGSSDTLVGGAGSETVSTSGNALMFGGTGALNFVGGAGTATIVGAPGGTEQVTVGGGGLVFGTGSANASTITGGTGGSTIFGGAGSSVDFVGSLAGGVFVAGAGSETLNAAQSSTSNLFAGSGVAGSSVLMVGGSGADTMIAGTGSATMTGGGGSNAFAFFASGTDGAQDFITDFNANDGLFLVGYAATQSVTSLLDAASVTTAGVTLTLSDQTRITFTNLNSVSTLEGHILNVGQTA